MRCCRQPQVYVEHSNEVWNAGFPQGRYASQMGIKLGLAADNNTARYRYHARRWGPQRGRARAL